MEDQEKGTEWNDVFPDRFDSAETFSNPSPSNWVAEIESMLFKDDDGVNMEPSQAMLDSFFSDILVDSSIVCDDLESNEHLLENFFSDNKSPNVSDESAPVSSSEEEKVSDEPEINNANDENHNDDVEADDPVSKKRRRQLRNRDAAVRSRERKKMYVKDLEMKSRYLEGECRRLGRLLQSVLAENQALHFTLQKGYALGASSAKQESAVLLLESLLLGSLLWFLGIMCLFTLPQLTQSNLESVEEKAPGNLAQREAGSNHFTLSGLKSRRCKASRTRMKLISHVLRA